jgi:hypothetical protein
LAGAIWEGRTHSHERSVGTVSARRYVGSRTWRFVIEESVDTRLPVPPSGTPGRTQRTAQRSCVHGGGVRALALMG